MHEPVPPCRSEESAPAPLVTAYHFAVPIYLADKPEFLTDLSEVSESLLEIERQKVPLDPLYPYRMTGSFYENPRVAPFAEYLGLTAWNILQHQGYKMDDKAVTFLEMWTQEHYKYSSMEQHAHGNGAQIVGFYFLEVPKNSSRVVFHDPRIAKTMIDLPQNNPSLATLASAMINFEPKPGLLIFTNAWLAHSFTRHFSDAPLKFVHFNLGVQFAPKAACCLPAEVI